MYELVCKEVQNLHVACLKYPNIHTKKVHQLLLEFQEYLAKVGVYTQDPSKRIELCYDLLTIYLGKIEYILQSRPPLVMGLFKMLEACAQDPNLPASIQMNHDLRKALIMNRYLGVGDLLKLAPAVYQRLAVFFTVPLEINLSQKLKMTLGNIFAAQNNVQALSDMTPYLTQFRLPMGALKKEMDACLNEIMTQILTHPRVNDTTALYQQNFPDQNHTLSLDFGAVLQVVNLLTHQDILKAMGNEPNGIDIQVLRHIMLLMKQCGEILLEGGKKSWLARSCENKSILKANLRGLFSGVIRLKPIYTWGSELDLCINDLMDLLRDLSRRILESLSESPDPSCPSEPIPSWGIMRFWEGGSKAISSFMTLGQVIVDNLTPRMTKFFMLILPQSKMNNVLHDIKVPIIEIFKQGKVIVGHLESKGVFHPETQQLIDLFRREMLDVQLGVLQQILAIYFHQFSPVMEDLLKDKAEPVKTWKNYSTRRKDEFMLNLAALMRCASVFMQSLIPFLASAKVREVENRLRSDSPAHQAYLTLCQKCADLQKVIIQELIPKIDILLVLLGQPGDLVTIGAAANAALESQVVGAVADVTFYSYKLNLGFMPTRQDYPQLPTEWETKNLKNIFYVEVLTLKTVIHQSIFLSAQRDERKRVECK